MERSRSSAPRRSPFRSPFREALEKVYAIHAPELAGPPPEHAYLPSGSLSGDFDRSGLFGPVAHESYPWSRSFSARSYVEYLRTVSRYQLMDKKRREDLLTAVAEAIEANGGSFDAPVETHLYFARRKA